MAGTSSSLSRAPCAARWNVATPRPRYHTKWSQALATLLTALLAACAEGADPAGPILRREGLVYSAEFVVEGPEVLIGRGRIANLGSARRVLHFPDPCVALFRFHDGDRLVWDQLTGNKTCVPPPIEITLEPGEVREFQRFAYAPAILAYMDLPAGRYEIVLFFRPDGGEVRLPLGQIQLDRPPPFAEDR